MRHRKAGVKLNRTTSHRQAMFKNMVTSLFKYDQIRTTDVKAKELRRWAEHIITLAKRGDLHARRQVMAIVQEKDVVHKLFENATQRFGSQNGGYTRIIKIGRRPGDAAPVSLIELVNAEPKATPKKKAKGEAKKKDAAAVSAPAAEEKTAAPDVESQEAAVEPETDAEPAQAASSADEAEQDADSHSAESDKGTEGPDKE
jgi:large subunit ribosomal protein L17